jgi:hypothetical protein
VPDGRNLAAFNAAQPHIARVYDYLLGGKDNISQVVSRWPHSDRTVDVQARQGIYSNVESLTVRELYRTSMGFMSGFLDGGS